MMCLVEKLLIDTLHIFIIKMNDVIKCSGFGKIIFKSGRQN